MWTSCLSNKLSWVVLLTLTFLQSPVGRAQTMNTSAAPAASDDASAAQQSTSTTKEDAPGASGRDKAANSAVDDGKPAGDAAPEVPKEDWNTLAIPPGMKIADPLFRPARSDYPKYTREFVQLQYRNVDIVDLYVLKPKGVEKPPVMLYLYSFPSDTDRFQADDFDELVTKNGFAAVGFVSALTGPRYHDRPGKQWFISELQESLAVSVHDVQFILNYLEKRGDLDMSRVGMFGGGSGASIAIMAAAADPRIKVLDLIGPWGDWPDWLARSPLVPNDERAAYLRPEFLKKVENLDPVKWLPMLTNQKVRLQYLKDDEITPRLVRERILKAAPANAQVVVYDSEVAYVSVMGSAGEKLFDWPKEQLGAVGEQKTAVKDATAGSAQSRE